MDNWQYHDKKMKELKQLYLKTSKQTQNRLQEIFDSIDFTFNNLYNIADKEHKNRINTYIEEWKDKGLLTGYFGLLAKNIYTRTRVKNSEILELLIYEAYIEEQSKLKEQELNIMYDDANYYYQEGQQEVNNTLSKKERKPINILKWALFLALLDQPNVKGYVYETYLEATIKYNADQIYRQMTIDLQQQKQPDITNDIYQNLIKRQNNSKLNINGDKISGDIDTQLIEINNLAKVKGIKEVDNNARVRFIAVIDGKETDMCHSLDGQLFYINRENVFDRYYGETQKDLRIERIKCFGLVVGLNLPPISHHFHWCRSTITYQVPVENKEKTEYNLDIPRISKEVKQILSNTKLNNKVKKLFNRYLTKDNVKIDYNDKKAMYYNVDSDKIIINPNHKDFAYYNLQEALTHEIVHMIDTRNKLLEHNKNIYSNIRSASIDINSNIDKYQKMFKDNTYYYDLCAGDTIGLLTGNKVKTFYYHPIGYTNIEEDIVANIETAYLTDNKIAMQLFEDNDVLNRLKDKVVKMYDKYTK